MPTAAIFQLTGRGVQDTVKDRNEHRRVTLAYQHIIDCLKYVNDVLVRQSDAAMFVTIFYGILHTPTGELEYCSGGHNPPYIVSPNGDLRLLDEPRSLIVGALEQGTFQTGHTTLRAGECILLFTDGVTEAVDSSRGEFSDARLRTVLEQNSSSPVDQIVENVISEVRIFSSG